jgi:hypothetical protein
MRGAVPPLPYVFIEWCCNAESALTPENARYFNLLLEIHKLGDNHDSCKMQIEIHAVYKNNCDIFVNIVICTKI